MTADGTGSTGGRPSGLTRRRLLAGLGGVGAVGMASGAGTFAHFSDAEAFADNAFGAGEVDIDLALDASCRGCVVGDDGRVHFEFADIDRGDSGRNVLSVDVQTNPSRLWLGTQCPPVPDRLGDAIEATLTAGDFSRTGSLSDLRRKFAGGLRLDDLDGDACLDPTSDPLEIVLDWRLPPGTPDRVAGSETSFDIHLYAEQCRHVSEDAAVESNPFTAFAPCDEPPACVVCEDDNGTKIGSLTFEYLGAESETVVATATSGGAGGVGQEGTVVFDETVAPDGLFTIDAGPIDVAGDDGNWIGPNLFVDDGSGPSSSGNSKKPDGVQIHTSCSERLAPGMVFGNFELVSGTTVDGEQLCDDTVEDPGEPDEPDDCVTCDDSNGDEDTSLQTLIFRYEGIDSAHLEVVSTKGNTGGVLFAGDLQTGDEFAIDGKDVERPGQGKDRLGPEIRIDRDDGEERTDVHVSCSKPLAAGMTFGSDDQYVIVGGITTDGQRICAAEEL